MMMKDAGGGDARSGSTATAENEGGNEAVGIEKEKEAEGGQGEITYRTYAKEEDLYALMSLVDQELSEPYSIFTYRYFVYNWPQLCFLAIEEIEGKEHCVGALVCKADLHKQVGPARFSLSLSLSLSLSMSEEIRFSGLKSRWTKNVVLTIFLLLDFPFSPLFASFLFPLRCLRFFGDMLQCS